MKGKCFCYLNGIEVKDSKARPFANVLEMTLNENMVEGNVVKTAGYYNAGDGGEATYLIRKKTENDTILTPGIHFVQNDLVAEMYVSDSEIVNARQFGAKGDSLTNDRNHIMDMIMSNDFKTYIIANGTYFIDEAIMLPSDRTLILKNATIVSNNKVNPILQIVGNNVNVIAINSKFQFTTQNEGQKMIEIMSSKNVKITGLELNRFMNGIDVTDSNMVTVRDCVFKIDNGLIYDVNVINIDEASENILVEDNFEILGPSHNPIVPPTDFNPDDDPAVDIPDVPTGDDEVDLGDPDDPAVNIPDPDHSDPVTPEE